MTTTSSDLPNTVACRVSVLIRSMDRDTLRDALDAVAAQQAPLQEVLVVNASGRPHRPLPPACGRFAMRLVEPADGRALSRPAAANLALQAASGEWLMFVDDDDLIDPVHIGRLYEAIATSTEPCVAAYAGVRLVDAAGQRIGSLDEPFDRLRLWCGNFLPIHAVLFAAATVRAQGQQFDEGLAVYEDWDFWHRLARHGRFLHVPGESATYRLIGASGLSVEEDRAFARQARLAVYRRWLPSLQVDELEQLGAMVERGRGDLQRARAEVHGLAHELGGAQQERADLARQLGDAELARIEDRRRADEELMRITEQARQVQEQLRQQMQAQIDVLEGRHSEAQRFQHELQAQLVASRSDYQTLEAGYRQVTSSLSWRITEPLRSLRGALALAALRAQARRGSRQVLRLLPLPAAARQRAKVWLAARAWAAPLLRWLAPPLPGHAAAAGDPPVRGLDKEAVRAAAERGLTQFLAGTQRLILPVPGDAPRVSVIVVLYNQAGLSLQCLQALAASTGVSFETLIVDNASTDRVPQLLDKVSGALLLPQTTNLGFLRAVNLAAAQARGEHLLLLNNDAVVEPEALARAVARLDSDPRIGAVGGPILLWDGQLQEAGSIVWRDGSCLGYGRGESPLAGPYRYRREVDYCSGAFLMLRRSAFVELGGFDEAFAPAYYEESDFCARLWESGRSVVFDPQVRIKHFEFASDDGKGGAIALQTRNRQRFADKHPDFLSERPQPDLSQVLRARQRLPQGARRVLFIDDRVPLPWLGQGYPRAAAFVQAIDAAGDFVTHYPLQFPHEAWDDVRRALPDTVEVMLDQGLAGLAPFLAARAGFYDLMVVSRPHNMAVVRSLRDANPGWFDGVTLVYDAEALFSVRDIAKAQVQGRPLPPAEQQRLIQSELALSQGADRVVAVSEAEARHYRQAGFGEVHVLGHTLVRRAAPPPLSGRGGFLFVGAVPVDDSPNGDSLIWFVREVWPHIEQALGDAARLDIVGPCDSATVRAMASSTIRVHGAVPSVEPFQAAARVFVVPTRYAAGIPHKAHEAAAAGLPMVVTPLIARQLGWEQELAVAATPQAFAAACLRLHGEDLAWQAQHRALHQLVQRDCSPAAFEAAVRRIVATPTRAAAA